MGVNRQQFDRYLTMDALPNKATTESICRYFAVEEAELYSDPAFVGITARSKRNDISLSDSGPIASRLFATAS